MSTKPDGYFRSTQSRNFFQFLIVLSLKVLRPTSTKSRYPGKPNSSLKIEAKSAHKKINGTNNRHGAQSTLLEYLDYSLYGQRNKTRLYI